MELKRTTEIFVKTNRRFVIRSAEESAEQILCRTCAEPLLSPQHCAAVFGIGERRLFQLVETGAAHFMETETGTAMICPSSLAAALDGGARQDPDASREEYYNFPTTDGETL